MSEPRPLLGVYLTVCNAADTIQEVLHAMEPIHGKWKLPFNEIVFVDVCSTDDTRDILASHFGFDEWPEESPHVFECWGSRVVFATTKDVGTAARDYAFSLTTAKWTAFLESRPS